MTPPGNSGLSWENATRKREVVDQDKGRNGHRPNPLLQPANQKQVAKQGIDHPTQAMDWIWPKQPAEKATP